MWIRWSRAFTSVLALASLLAAGCSVIGLGLGAISDSKKPDRHVIPGWQIGTLEPGTPVSVVLEGGEVAGTYLGTSRLDASLYAEKYAEAVSDTTLGVSLPALGDAVTMTVERAAGEVDSVACEVDGFDYGVVWIRADGADTLRSLPLISVRRITTGSGNELDGAALRTAVSSRRVPHRSALLLDSADPWDGSEDLVIPIDEILQVTVDVTHHAALTGFVVGLVVDAVIVAVVVNNASSPSPSSVSYSCPFVYTHDGERYRLDTETFGGALFRAAQRTDFDTLDHLREVGDEYRLLVTNELRETQYVDELKLLVVDHPPGTNVIPSFEGDLHVLTSAVGPVAAADDRGQDALSLVGETDDLAWISVPFGRDGSRPGDARDGLELAFPRPADAASAKLALNVRNTLWASYLQGHLLELFGTDLDDWYAHLNSSAEAREELHDAMVREGMLLVKVWDGTSWRTEGFVWEVGPSVARDRVVTLDVPDLPGEELRVRLESTPGFWVVDSARIDYAPNPPVFATEVAVSSAVDHSGRDVRELLVAADGRHYVMPTLEDRAELVYPVPPRTPGTDRSVVLVSTGYYTIHVPTDGEPRPEIVGRLLREPGAYGRFTLHLLEERLWAAVSRETDEEGGGG